MKKINNSKKVSVVVCAMNCEKIISSCLKSILKNNPLEIIVVDGLSNDNTKKNALKFKNVKVFVLKGGIFSCFYSLIFDSTKKIPFLNILLISICLIFDKLTYIFLTKNIKEITPIGYFFTAEK